MGIIDESFDKLKKNVHHINSGAATHPFDGARREPEGQEHRERVMHSESEKAFAAEGNMVRNFYGRKP